MQCSGIFIYRYIIGIYIYTVKLYTIFSQLLNLAKLAMTLETVNLLALNVRSKVTLYSSKSHKCSSTIHQNAKLAAKIPRNKKR